MQEVQDDHYSQSMGMQPALLTRITSVLPMEPSSLVADSFIDGPEPLIPTGRDTSVPILITSPSTQQQLQPLSGSVVARTPVYPTLGIPHLLPILYLSIDHALVSAPGTASLNEQGHIDLTAHSHFIYATGAFYNNSPSWTTTLMTSKHIGSQSVHEAMMAHVPIPFGKCVPRGRNGVLIAPSDPKSNDKIDQLFDNTDRFAFLKFYINRVWFTPPELCEEVHTHALEWWNEQQAVK